MLDIILRLFNFLLITCRIPVLGINVIKFSTSRSCSLSKCDAHSVCGKRNTVVVAAGSKLTRCRFIIKGNDNLINIGSGCRMSRTTFWISGDGNQIVIGKDTTIGNNCEIATLEGTSVWIGNDCMLSHDIRFRTSDSHSIVNNLGKRINKAKDISIGNHVWIGLQVLIMKGSKISDNSVVAARATVTKEFCEPGIIVAGAPANKIKGNINWDRRKLSV